MAKTQKYYVVWKGHQPGVYDSWDECRRQILQFPGAEYKSFARHDEAVAALAGDYSDYRGTDTKTYRKTPEELRALGVLMDSICVDAACSGNPGDVEYRGVDTRTGEELFRQGPYLDGTVNLGEFLAIVHGLAWLQQRDRECPIYSDSRVAMGWVQKRVMRTKLTQTPTNAVLFGLVRRALAWLETNRWDTPILKWQTRQWGENPADFGRK